MIRRILARINTLTEGFVPISPELVNTTPVVPAGLSHETLRQAAELYHENDALSARGQVVQLCWSKNPAFHSLDALSVEILHNNSLSMEARCLTVLGAIMTEVAERMEAVTRV